MRHLDIEFDDMNAKLIEAIPELQAAFEHEESKWTMPQGPHIIYSFVFFEYVKRLLLSATQEPQALHRVFDYVELLATHPDERIQEVVYFAVCENIAADPDLFDKASPWMGPRTLDFCQRIRRRDHPREV